MIVLVTGPESCGNRMLCRMLAEAGADVLHRPMPMSTHWRPGMPGTPETWDGVWTDFSTLVWDSALVLVRDPFCALKAQVDTGHVRDEQHAHTRYRASLVSIFSQLGVSDKPWFVVPYESLAKDEAVMAYCDWLSLPRVPVTKWQDANSKYYGGEVWSDRTPLWKRPTL